LNALKKPALLLENEHLNFVELTKYTPSGDVAKIGISRQISQNVLDLP